MKIPDEVIAQVKEAADVVEVIGDYVTLKKKGKYYMACCPFHQEKTPSFTVTPSLGIYKCYGCGKSGDSIQFVMDHEGLGYLEAIKQLASKYGIEFKEEVIDISVLQSQNEKESIYIALNYAKNYFHKTLLENDEGKSSGLSYFVERGYNDPIIKKFELGYSLDSWDALGKQAIKDGYSREILEKAGLITVKEERITDRFRGRVIFPIHNLAGKVIAFGARILRKDKTQAKYLNSPETEVYHKSEILYGVFHAKQSIRQEDNCFLVEGYTDVISLHLAGIQNVVASSGTSLTEGQIKLIGRYTKNVTILYDGDSAGIKASLRGIDLILQEGLNVRAVVFPEGEDPDSYSQKIGSEAFKTYLSKNSRDFLTFKTELYLKDIGDDPLKKAEVIKDVVHSISLIPDDIKRRVFYKECSRILKIEEDVLIKEGNKLRLSKSHSKKEEVGQPEISEGEYEIPEEVLKPEVNPLFRQEQETIRLLLSYGQELLEGQTKLYQYVFQELEDIDFESPLYSKFFNLYRSYLHDGVVPEVNFFIDSADEEIKKEAINLLSERYSISEDWEKKFSIVIPTEKNKLLDTVFSNILRLKYRKVQKLIQENAEQLKAAGTFEEQMHFLQIDQELKNTKKELGNLLGIIISF